MNKRTNSEAHSHLRWWFLMKECFVEHTHLRRARGRPVQMSPINTQLVLDVS